MTKKNTVTVNNLMIDSLYQEYSSLYQELSAHLGISYSSLLILNELNMNQPLTQKELSERLFLPKQTIHSSVNSLVKSGILEIKPSEKNSKSKDVFITSEGESYSQSTVIKLNEAERRAVERISTKEMEQLIKLTKKHLICVQEEIHKEFNF